MQLLDRERFGEISISTTLQSLQTVTDIRLRGQHDHRQVVDVSVCAYHAEHREAIHLWHHHVADNQVVVVRQQLAQSVLTITTHGEMIVVTQFLTDETRYLLVIVNHQNTIGGGRLLITFQLQTRRLVLSIVNLTLREVTVALRQANCKDATLDIVLTVATRDHAVVHIHNHLTEVQADACALHMGSGCALIETVKKMLQGTLSHARSCVCDADLHVLLQRATGLFVIALRQGNGYLTLIVTVFKRVGQQVGHHLVELCTINPHWWHIVISLKRKRDATLLGRELIQLTYALQELLQIRLLTMQPHLLLVYLTDIQDLVHQVEDTLRVVVNRIHRRLQDRRLERL